MDNRTCPNCHNNQLAGDDSFCWNCGFELGNYCENPDCEDEDSITILPNEFTFCPRCGSKTRYAKLGFAKQIEFEQVL